ncbi:MAG: response regulator [Methylocystaceae bacterium]|nr:response regulator [Methylocystaceae bacterium]
MRVLFVDDEMNVLNALKRSFNRSHLDWDIQYVNGAQGAIALFEEQPFDVLVTDMMMPQMGGDELLNYVVNHYPRTACVVLSGHYSQEKTFRLVGCEHLYLSKPCSFNLLIETIEKAKELSDLHHSADKVQTKEQLEEEVRKLLTSLLISGRISKSDIPGSISYLLKDYLLQSFGPNLDANEYFQGSVADQAEEYIAWVDETY